MRFNEPTAALRRIPIYLGITGGVPVTGDLQVSLSGAAWQNAAGTWNEVGDGEYYYEASQAETVTLSYLAIRVNRDIGIEDEYKTYVDIGDRIAADEDDPTALRLPIFLIDVDGNPVTELSPTADLSLNGAGFVAATNAIAETGQGAYYLTLAVGELTEGYGVLIVAAPGTTGYRHRWQVRPTPLAAEDPPAPIEADEESAGLIEEIDHVTAALARLPHMYRGTGG